MDIGLLPLAAQLAARLLESIGLVALVDDGDIIEPVVATEVRAGRLVEAVAQDDLERLEGRVQTLAERDVPEVVAEQVEIAAVVDAPAVSVEALVGEDLAQLLDGVCLASVGTGPHTYRAVPGQLLSWLRASDEPGVFIICLMPLPF
jgi:hypothetical protein